MTKTIAAVIASVWAALSLAAGASAHGIIVTPPGQTDPVVSEPISQPFAQAHCHAQSPAELGDSPAAAQFVPGAALPCPGVQNPGGQVTGP
jgi:hypothetical protein